MTNGLIVAMVAGCIAIAMSAHAGSSLKGEAKATMAERCAACHGDNGDGNGPSSEYLVPKPSDFRDKKWQASVTDATIAKAIVYGGQAVGKSISMASNPDLEGRPDLVKAIVKRIRAFGK
jgi:mono/diheme cytochrome c family protein